MADVAVLEGVVTEGGSVIIRSRNVANMFALLTSCGDSRCSALYPGTGNLQFWFRKLWHIAKKYAQFAMVDVYGMIT